MTDTATQVLDADTALSLIEECVKERGTDYRYNDHYDTCVYVNGTGYLEVSNAPHMAPLCLIGLALYKFGVTAETLAKWQASINAVFGWVYVWPIDSNDMKELTSEERIAEAARWARDTWEKAEMQFERGGLSATDEAVRVLFAAQIVQDCGGTWGDALIAAQIVRFHQQTL